MDPILAEFESFADKIHPASPTEEIVFLSTTSGRAMDRNVALSGHDWASQIRQPVRFRECVLEAQKRGCNVFLEIGPDGTLSSLIRATLDNKVRSLASLDRKVDDWRMMLRAFGEMYCLGVALDIHRGVKAAAGSRRMELPKYPFQRQHYPLDVVDSTVNPASTQAGAPERDIAVNRVSARPAAASIDSPALDGANCDQAAVALSAIAKICGMDVDAIDLDQSFVHDLGFSSIMLAELTAALREKVPRLASIPLGFYFGGGSVGKFLQQSGLDSSATPLMQLSPLNGPQLLPANGAPALASNGAHALPAGFGDALVICEAWAKEFDRNVVRRVPRHWVHQHNNGNILLARQELVASRTVVGEASRDLMHPFFYDHAQDHVPGMYVIEVVRQLITASGHAYFGVEMTRKFVLNELNSQFDRFIEPEDPFFMVLDHAASRFNDGVMTDVDCVAHIVQHGGVVAQVRGRGRAMESNEYSRIRGDRAVVSNVGSATSEQSSSVASE
jgi:malonyl CoA-acyl carrier protein transacylase